MFANRKKSRGRYARTVKVTGKESDDSVAPQKRKIKSERRSFSTRRNFRVSEEEPEFSDEAASYDAEESTRPRKSKLRSGRRTSDAEESAVDRTPTTRQRKRRRKSLLSPSQPFDVQTSDDVPVVAVSKRTRRAATSPLLESPHVGDLPQSFSDTLEGTRSQRRSIRSNRANRDSHLSEEASILPGTFVLSLKADGSCRDSTMSKIRQCSVIAVSEALKANLKLNGPFKYSSDNLAPVNLARELARNIHVSGSTLQQANQWLHRRTKRSSIDFEEARISQTEEVPAPVELPRPRGRPPRISRLSEPATVQVIPPKMRTTRPWRRSTGLAEKRRLSPLSNVNSAVSTFVERVIPAICRTTGKRAYKLLENQFAAMIDEGKVEDLAAVASLENLARQRLSEAKLNLCKAEVAAHTSVTLWQVATSAQLDALSTARALNGLGTTPLQRFSPANHGSQGQSLSWRHHKPPSEQHAFVKDSPEWSDERQISAAERDAFGDLFAAGSISEEDYISARASIIQAYQANPQQYLSPVECCAVTKPFDILVTLRIFEFLERSDSINVQQKALVDVRNTEDKTLPRCIRRCTVCRMPCPYTFYTIAVERFPALPQQMLTDACTWCTTCFEKRKFSPSLDPEHDFHLVKLSIFGGLVAPDWEDSELEKLFEGLTEHGSSWDAVAKHVGSRTAKECLQVFLRLPFEDEFIGSSSGNCSHKPTSPIVKTADSSATVSAGSPSAGSAASKSSPSAGDANIHQMTTSAILNPPITGESVTPILSGQPGSEDFACAVAGTPSSAGKCFDSSRGAAAFMRSDDAVGFSYSPDIGSSDVSVEDAIEDVFHLPDEVSESTHLEQRLQLIDLFFGSEARRKAMAAALSVVNEKFIQWYKKSEQRSTPNSVNGSLQLQNNESANDHTLAMHGRSIDTQQIETTDVPMPHDHMSSEEMSDLVHME